MKSNKKKTLNKLLGEQPIQTLGDYDAFVSNTTRTYISPQKIKL